MRPTSVRAIMAAIFALLFTAGVVFAAGAGVTIQSVGGQAVRSDGSVARAVSGQVAVTGTAQSAAGQRAPAPARKPLVADAGDSSFVSVGTPAYLVGAGFGGVAPYSFSWSTTAGEIAAPDAPEAILDTARMAAGTYTIKLTVRDSAGASDSDTVKVAVYDANPTVLLNRTVNDATPGTFVGGDRIEFPFNVPAGVQRIDVALTWALPANDYDLEIYDPKGVKRGGSGNSVGTPEGDGVANPEAGAWKAVAIKYTTVPDSVTVKVTAVATSNPLPSVDTTGPYRFVEGAAQNLKGTVTGGTAPLTIGWDTDFDGRIDQTGLNASTNLGPDRHLVTFKVTDAKGFERRETTSVFVGSADRIAQATTPLTIIAIADSGINAYHLEYSAKTYPDPEVLALTDNFTRHPSQYIPGYPDNALALPITLDKGYYPAADKKIWASIKKGQLYWIPGTKIIGALDANDSAATNAAADGTPILDDDGHGSGTTSVSTGNRYGYCPSCLLFFVEGLDETVAANYPFIDIASYSFGYTGGAPLGPAVGPNGATKMAAERGQTTLFAAGNGVGNAFDVPVATWGSDQTGASWNITVGAIRRDNNRAIVGDGIPVDISAWGDGNLPSACRTGTVGQCAFGGTSAATPYTAGVFGAVLTEVRRAIGDPKPGQRPGQVVAEGVAIPGSIYLDDGRLTRAELREAVLKTALPLNTENRSSIYPFPMTAPYADDINVLFEGYGAATPESARRAIDVILGRAMLPDRSFEDQFFALDQAVKDTIYGGYDRDGDGSEDFQGFAGSNLSPASVATVEGTLSALRLAQEKLGNVAAAANGNVQNGQNALTFYLHRRFTAEPDKASSCHADDNETSMDSDNTDGDIECFENRVTSVLAAFRPLGIYPATVLLDAPLPAGSDVYATVYIASEQPGLIKPSGVLMATDREIGTGQGSAGFVIGSGTGPGSNAQGNDLPDLGGCAALGELCWTKFDLSFKTTRPAFTGERLTFQIALVGARAYAFGHEAGHASKVAIVAAPMPASGLDFGVTISEPGDGATYRTGSTAVAGGTVAFPDLGSDPSGAGDHPVTHVVEISVDDAAFGSPIEATVDEEHGTWSAPMGALADGAHKVYARARMDNQTSDVVSASFRFVPESRVEYQVVKKNAAPDPNAWRAANGVASWSFTFDSSSVGHGQKTIVVRLVENGLVVGQDTVRVKVE